MPKWLPACWSRSLVGLSPVPPTQSICTPPEKEKYVPPLGSSIQPSSSAISRTAMPDFWTLPKTSCAPSGIATDLPSVTCPKL